MSATCPSRSAHGNVAPMQRARARRLCSLLSQQSWDAPSERCLSLYSSFSGSAKEAGRLLHLIAMEGQLPSLLSAEFATPLICTTIVVEGTIIDGRLHLNPPFYEMLLSSPPPHICRQRGSL